MQSPPISQAEIDARIGSHIDELLELWWAEQGASKPRETPFVAGFEEWKAKQPPRYTRENWERFWSRANELLGYDHTALLGPRDASRIGDDMSVAGWMRLLERAGFELVDVLLRDADQVVVGALKSVSGEPGAIQSERRLD